MNSHIDTTHAPLKVSQLLPWVELDVGSCFVGPHDTILSLKLSDVSYLTFSDGLMNQHRVVVENCTWKIRPCVVDIRWDYVTVLPLLVSRCG